MTWDIKLLRKADPSEAGNFNLNDSTRLAYEHSPSEDESDAGSMWYAVGEDDLISGQMRKALVKNLKWEGTDKTFFSLPRVTPFDPGNVEAAAESLYSDVASPTCLSEPFLVMATRKDDEDNKAVFKVRLAVCHEAMTFGMPLCDEYTVHFDESTLHWLSNLTEEELRDDLGGGPRKRDGARDRPTYPFLSSVLKSVLGEGSSKSTSQMRTRRFLTLKVEGAE